MDPNNNHNSIMDVDDSILSLSSPPDLKQMFINSTDTLFHEPIDQKIPSTWNDRPPLFKKFSNQPQHGGVAGRGRNWLRRLRGGNNNNGVDNEEDDNNWELEEPNLLKGMIRKGIPGPLRCAVWLSNIIQSCNPHQDIRLSHEYRTLAKVRILDHAYQSIWQQDNNNTTNNNHTGNPSGSGGSGIVKKQDVQRLEFGNTFLFDFLSSKEQSTTTTTSDNTTTTTNNTNIRILEEVLYGLQYTIVLEYAPLVPVLAALFLRFMSESYVFCAIREMSHYSGAASSGNSYFYFPTTQREVVAYESAFMDILEKLHPQTAQGLQKSGYQNQYTRSVFQNLFLEILLQEHVFRIVDIYTLEGSKVLFRFGVALIVLFHRDYKEQRNHATNNNNNNNNNNFIQNMRLKQHQQQQQRKGNHDCMIHASDSGVSGSGAGGSSFDSGGTGGENETTSANNNDNNSNNDWWECLLDYCHHRLNFEVLVKKAYGVHGKGVRKRYRFPRRPIIQRIIQLEEEQYWKNQHYGNNSGSGSGSGSGSDYSNSSAAAAGEGGSTLTSNTNNTNNNDDDDFMAMMYQMVQPLGLVPAKQPEDVMQEPIVPKLAESTLVRTKLAEWLPLSLRFTKLDLIYSTNHHGRTLDRFYHHVQKAKHTITLLEPLSSFNDDNNDENNNNCIVGMYASQIWHASTKVYGDGACCLFRIFPDNPDKSQCWKWNPKQILEVVADDDIVDDDEEEEHGGFGGSNYSHYNNNKTALLEQFQVGTPDYISMGGNSDGSAGLRLNEDLTKAESSPADGFDNVPLAGKEFEVGLVEVYQIVRQIDGVGIR